MILRPKTTLIPIFVAVLVTLVYSSPVVAAEPTVSVQGADIASSVSFAPTTRPSEMSYGPDTGITAVSWTEWGDSTARGSGIFDAYGGETEIHLPVTIELSKVRRCGPFLIYTSASVLDANGKSPTPMRLSVACRIYTGIVPEGAEPIELLTRPSSWWNDDNHIRGMKWKNWHRAATTGRGRYRFGSSYGRRLHTKTGAIQIRYSKIGFCPSHGVFYYQHARSKISYRGKRISSRSGRSALDLECR